MPQLSVELPTSLRAALDAESIRSGRNPSSIIAKALAQYLDKPIHTVFQVSTSGALVAGVFDREVSVQTVLEHGDFGLGMLVMLMGLLATCSTTPPSRAQVQLERIYDEGCDGTDQETYCH